MVTGLDLESPFWESTQSWNVFNKALAAGSGFGTFQLFDASDLVNPVNHGSNGSFSFNSGTGALAWNAVPEPTGALAGLLLASGLWRRRRSIY